MIHGVFPKRDGMYTFVRSLARSFVYSLRAAGKDAKSNNRASRAPAEFPPSSLRMCGNIETLLHSAPAVIQRLAGA